MDGVVVYLIGWIAEGGIDDGRLTGTTAIGCIPYFQPLGRGLETYGSRPANFSYFRAFSVAGEEIMG